MDLGSQAFDGVFGSGGCGTRGAVIPAIVRSLRTRDAGQHPSLSLSHDQQCVLPYYYG